MGCHINLYEVIPCSKDINELVNKYYENFDKLGLFFKNPYLYYFYKNYREGKKQQKIRVGSIWATRIVDFIDNDCRWNITPIKHNQGLNIFKELSFNIPCDLKGKTSKRIYPEFIELKEVNCPWVRGGEYDIHFTDKDTFLKYFREEFFAYSMWTDYKAEKWVDYKEDYQFFADTFVNGKHLIKLG